MTWSIFRQETMNETDLHFMILEQEDCDGNFKTTMPCVPFSVLKKKTQTVKTYMSTGILATLLLKHDTARSSRVFDTNENPLWLNNCVMFSEMSELFLFPCSSRDFFHLMLSAGRLVFCTYLSIIASHSPTKLR